MSDPTLLVGDPCPHCEYNVTYLSFNGKRYCDGCEAKPEPPSYAEAYEEEMIREALEPEHPEECKCPECYDDPEECNYEE